jgi:hypothetical protein
MKLLYEEIAMNNKLFKVVFFLIFTCLSKQVLASETRSGTLRPNIVNGVCKDSFDEYLFTCPASTVTANATLTKITNTFAPVTAKVFYTGNVNFVSPLLSSPKATLAQGALTAKTSTASTSLSIRTKGTLNKNYVAKITKEVQNITSACSQGNIFYVVSLNCSDINGQNLPVSYKGMRINGGPADIAITSFSFRNRLYITLTSLVTGSVTQFSFPLFR